MGPAPMIRMDFRSGRLGMDVDSAESWGAPNIRQARNPPEEQPVDGWPRRGAKVHKKDSEETPDLGRRDEESPFHANSGPFFRASCVFSRPISGGSISGGSISLVPTIR